MHSLEIFENNVVVVVRICTVRYSENLYCTFITIKLNMGRYKKYCNKMFLIDRVESQNS